MNKIKNQIATLIKNKGSHSVDYFHKKLGKIMWNHCGMERNKEGLEKAIEEIKNLRERFSQELRVSGGEKELNPELEKAGRVSDFLELGELMCRDAKEREESCGGHFREEHQTKEGEAERKDDLFTHVTAWEHNENISKSKTHKEELSFENIQLKQRSYK